MKDLTKEDVKNTAEYLIEKFGSTTEQDVKNRLRNGGFKAFQNDINVMMYELAQEENWTSTFKGNLHVYRFGPDTDESLLKYFEKQDAFWEISVQAKELTLVAGKIGKNGETETKSFSSNRKAVSSAKNLIEQQKEQGFAEAIDKRLPLALRKKVGNYLEQKPIKCQIGYYNVSKTDKKLAQFTFEEGNNEGYIIFKKNVGCQFTWYLPQTLHDIKRVLNSEKWSPLFIQSDEQKMLGEKVQTKTAYAFSEEILDEYLEVKLAETTELIDWEVNNDNVFQITFDFENGQKVHLSKFDLNYKEEMLPVAKMILENA
jgi:predicted DNA-binding WGR domain protein